MSAAASRTAADRREAAERRLMLAFLLTGFAAMFVGAAIGPLQALNYAGVNAYPLLRPLLASYYQGLTIHGVLNAYVFPFLVTCGLLVYLPARELGVSPHLGLWRMSFVLLALGAVLLLAAMFAGSSDVLWTFYPPLKGSPFFYLGMTSLAAGSLCPLPVLLGMRARWKRARPGELTPLVTYMSLVTMLMWAVSATGVVVELVGMLDPWSLGLVGTVDPIVARTLFWLTGHPIVYFWLMPAYVSWYGLLARQCGGKLVSDPMARLTFAMLLVFSLPVGTHHQFQDPGFSPVWRAIVVALTMSVALPSLITAFTIALTLEYAGRLRGGRGLLGWFTALPWHDPAVAAQVLGAVAFILGGASGITQGSWQLDNVVHNTVFLPGHFHLTVGSVVAMTFMSVAFWMIPHLTGRRLRFRRLALVSVWAWFAGMMLMGIGLNCAGLFGVPRRDWVSALPHGEYLALYGAARLPLVLAAVGGAILAAALILFLLVLAGTLLAGARLPARPPIPFAQSFGGRESYALTLEPATAVPVGMVAAARLSPLAAALEHVGIMAAATAAIAVAAYVPILMPFLAHVTRAPGWVAW